jgi:chromosome segregation ATPase
LNFIIGRNGSGKSAILTGISVGLGAKATDTNRGSSIKDLIKDGKSTARTSITLANVGDDAYMPHIYGRAIIINRKIQRHGTNSYSIMSADGRVICTKKSTIDDILSKFNITIDNPMAFLSQDKAREFLTSTSDSSKFDYFMSGANITDIVERYEKAHENILVVRQKFLQSRTHFQATDNTYIECKRLFDRYSNSANLRRQLTLLHGKIYWFNAMHVEKKLAEYQQRIQQVENEISELEAKMHQLDESITQCETKGNDVKHDMEVAKGLLEKVKAEESSLRQERETLKVVIQQNQQEIQNHRTSIEEFENQIEKCRKSIDVEQKRIDEIKGGSKDVLQTELQTYSSQIEALSKEKDEINRQLVELADTNEIEMTEAKSQINLIENDIKNLRTRKMDIEASQRDIYIPWGHKMKHLILEIKKTRIWHKEPIGPIGSFVEVKQEYIQWKPILNVVLNQSLDSFVVCDEHDRQVLSKLMRGVGLIKNIIVRRFEPFNYEQGKPSGLVTFVDIIKTSNDIVLYSLVDTNKIERSVICPSRERAQEYASLPSVGAVFTLFRNNSGQRIRKQNNTFRFDPVYFQSDLAKLCSGSEGSGSDIREIESEMATLKENLQSQKKTIRDLQIASQNRRQELERKRYIVNSQLAQLDRQIFEVQEKLNENGDLAKIEALQLEIDEYQKQIETNRGVIESLTDDVEQPREASKKLKQKINAMKPEIENARKQLEQSQLRLIDFETDLETEKTEREQYNHEKLRQENHMTVLKDREAQGKEKLASLIETAENICPREEIVFSENDTRDSISSEYAEIDRQVQLSEQTLGKLIDEVQRELNEAISKREEAERRQESLQRTLQLLSGELKTRLKCFETTIQQKEQQSKRAFERALELRGFKGKLDFDFASRKLTLLVLTMRDVENRSVTSLSGGEKSFTQIALLLAIWKVMDSKIRGLDEFDVFMDSVNRSMSIKLLLNELRQYPKSQNIFITPQDIAVVGDLDKDDVKIHKMRDPRADN